MAKFMAAGVKSAAMKNTLTALVLLALSGQALGWSKQGHQLVGELAEREHVSSRTLIRKLRDEGLTYQQLLDRVREDLACWWLLHSDMSVEAIADRLGYQDTSNFSRTFRRWVGMTPSEFQRLGDAPSAGGRG